MATQATVILDSGAFLTENPAPDKWEIGYFKSAGGQDEIRIFVDGKQVYTCPLITGQQQPVVEVQHLTASGGLVTGITCDPTHYQYEFTWKKLYGFEVDVDPAKFDCVLRFHSGIFRPSMIKDRVFKYVSQESGDQEPPQTIAVPHNYVVSYAIKDADEFKFIVDGQIIWPMTGVKHDPGLLEIEIAADNTTAEKFYWNCLKDPKPSDYWVPNQGDPPPILPP